MSTTKRQMGQRQVLTAWLHNAKTLDYLAPEPWRRAAHERALIRAFKRGVKFARTGK